MKRSTSLALAAALGASLCAGAAHAQDMRREFDTLASVFDTLASGRAIEGEAVRMRLTIPFGQAEADQRDTRLSFGFQQGDGEGGLRSMDVFSLSLNGDAQPQIETPFAYGAADGEGGFFSKPLNWLWIGLGVGAAYWIYDESQDDDDEQQVML
jgi:hypothetical protein